MRHPERIAYGLRSSATESESESLSDFSTFSDSDDSFPTGFDAEKDLPQFEDISPKKGTSPSSTELAIEELPPPVRESWSEIDEKERLASEKRLNSRDNKAGAKGAAKGSLRRESSGTSRSDRSDSWRSKPAPRRRPERKRQERRRPRSDPPLKGAVERPYTLPSGPITVLRRPTSEANNDVGIQKAASSEIRESGGSQRLLSSGSADGDSIRTPNSSKARVVNTRFGEAFVVDNPANGKILPKENKTLIYDPDTKVARKAATEALAGLNLGQREYKNSGHITWDSANSFDTYDRTMGGKYKPPQVRGALNSRKGKGKPAVSSDRGFRGSKPRPNVFIGRRPKLETRHVREEDFLLGD